MNHEIDVGHLQDLSLRKWLNGSQEFNWRSITRGAKKEVMNFLKNTTLFLYQNTIYQCKNICNNASKLSDGLNKQID